MSRFFEVQCAGFPNFFSPANEKVLPNDEENDYKAEESEPPSPTYDAFTRDDIFEIIATCPTPPAPSESGDSENDQVTTEEIQNLEIHENHEATPEQTQTENHEVTLQVNINQDEPPKPKKLTLEEKLLEFLTVNDDGTVEFKDDSLQDDDGMLAEKNTYHFPDNSVRALGGMDVYVFGNLEKHDRQLGVNWDIGPPPTVPLMWTPGNMHMGFAAERDARIKTLYGPLPVNGEVDIDAYLRWHHPAKLYVPLKH